MFYERNLSINSLLQGKCGLFSLLPAPKHASVKTTNRPLLPYTLSKKPVPNKPVPPKIAHAQTVAKPSKPVLQLPGRLNDDSDDEGDTVPSTSNFFSLGEHREKDSVAQSHQPNVTPTGSEVAKQEPSLRGPWQAPEAAASTLLGSTLTRTHNVQANDNTATCGPDPHSVFKASASAGSEKLPERDHISDAPLSFSRKSQEWGTGSSYAIPGTSVATSSVQSAADYAEPDTNSTYTYANYSEDVSMILMKMSFGWPYFIGETRTKASEGHYWLLTYDIGNICGLPITFINLQLRLISSLPSWS